MPVKFVILETTLLREQYCRQMPDDILRLRVPLRDAVGMYIEALNRLFGAHE